MRWRTVAHWTKWLAAALVAVELLYLLVANAVIFSGLIQRAAKLSPEVAEMDWDRGYSPWPGRVYVSGFRLAVQDGVLQFRLTVARARLDVGFWHLVQKKFSATRVHARGVTWRMVTRFDTVAGMERRAAAFPPIAGLPRPALRAKPAPPPFTPEQVDALWSVQLEDVHATVDELWFLEYRYRGPATVHGRFALSPLRRLDVGPATLALEGGELSAGEYLLSRALTAKLEVTIAPVDLQASPGLRVLQTLTAAVRFDTALESLGVAELYVDGVHATGPVRLAADLKVANGRLLPEASLEAWLTGLDARAQGFGFTGDAHARLSGPTDTHAPAVTATLSGALTVPLPEHKHLAARLSDVTAELVFSGADLSRDLGLARFSAVLGEARVHDVRQIVVIVGSVVPVFAPYVLGDGPLVAAGTAYMTPEYTLIRLKRLELGDASLEGAAVPGANGWTGALAGHFGKIPVGLRVRNSKLESALFAPDSWLGVELLAAGIKPD